MRSQTSGRWSVVLVVALVSTACSSSSAEVDTNDDAATAAAKYLEVTSDFQKEMLSDGVVSDAEYERANLAVIACIEDSGFIHAQMMEGAGKLKRGVSASWQGSDDPATDEELRAQADTIQTECLEEYWRAVDHVYRKQAKPTEAERVKLLEELVECFRKLGVDDLGMGSSQQEFERAALRHDQSTDGLDGSRCLTQGEMAFFEYTP